MWSAIHQIGLHFSYPLIQSEYLFVHFLQIRDFSFHAYVLPRFSNGIAIFRDFFLSQPDRFACLAGGSDTGSSTRRAQHLIQGNPFYISIAALVSRQHTYPHTKINVGTAIIHFAIHQAHIIVKGMFKIKIYIITPFFQSSSHDFL